MPFTKIILISAVPNYKNTVKTLTKIGVSDIIFLYDDFYERK